MNQPVSESTARRSGIIRLALLDLPRSAGPPKCGPGALKVTAIDGRVPSPGLQLGQLQAGLPVQHDPGLAPRGHRWVQGGEVPRSRRPSRVADRR